MTVLRNASKQTQHYSSNHCIFATVTPFASPLATTVSLSPQRRHAHSYNPISGPLLQIGRRHALRLRARPRHQPRLQKQPNRRREMRASARKTTPRSSVSALLGRVLSLHLDLLLQETTSRLDIHIRARRAGSSQRGWRPQQRAAGWFARSMVQHVALPIMLIRLPPPPWTKPFPVLLLRGTCHPAGEDIPHAMRRVDVLCQSSELSRRVARLLMRVVSFCGH